MSQAFRPLTLTALLQPRGSLRLSAYEAECRVSLVVGRGAARECLSSAMRQRRLDPGSCCSMSKQFAVVQVLRELVVAVKSPLLCGAEHDEDPPRLQKAIRT